MKLFNPSWPIIKQYDQDHLSRIALPLGGLGTGTVSLGGRGDLRDWEIMNKPGKTFTPRIRETGPFFALYTSSEKDKTCRLMEGPLEAWEYEGSHGAKAPNAGLPRFKSCSFATAYPLGQVCLSDPQVPLSVRIEGFNPLIPGDSERSGLPVAVLRFVLKNSTSKKVNFSVCGTIPNFIGMDGSDQSMDWKSEVSYKGTCDNENIFRKSPGLNGIFMKSNGVKPYLSQYGTMSLTTTEAIKNISYRTDWLEARWGNSLLDFWDDFSQDGILKNRSMNGKDMPMASLAVSGKIAPKAERTITFLINWHFPNRYTWTPRKNASYKSCDDTDIIGNFYTTQFADAWDAALKIAKDLPGLEKNTVEFVKAFSESTIPQAVKEAALFNVSTLRSQTCFRTPDGNFFGFEGISNHKGSCHGSCTHVWNYEQATAFLFGDLAKSMRKIEFIHSTNRNGLMSFRTSLPLSSRSRKMNLAAADGQMGCLMKLYRDWQLSGDDKMLKELWSKAKKALKFCWIPGGWDADQDGVMEGCQHNTMDVEYFGPNPQMTGWYLGALRAAEEMANYLGDSAFAKKCHKLFKNGSKWMDKNLFNGEYYKQIIQAPKSESDIATGLKLGMGSKDLKNPEFQLGDGCLIDQLVGQFMAHVCDLGYLHDQTKINKTLKSILKYNTIDGKDAHFNCLRSFVLGEEKAMTMASYPNKRPQFPFSYFTEVMTGFEYTAAIGMIYEGMIEEGIDCINNIRERYNGKHRNPFSEAECGHHYARAMASWAGLLALSGFHYSAPDKTVEFKAQTGQYFWSNGYSWGTCKISKKQKNWDIVFTVMHGELACEEFILKGVGSYKTGSKIIKESIKFNIKE